MSQQQPQLYNNLTAALGPEEQQIIKAALENADKIAAEERQRQVDAGSGQTTGAGGVSQQQPGVPQTNGGS